MSQSQVLKDGLMALEKQVNWKLFMDRELQKVFWGWSSGEDGSGKALISNTADAEDSGDTEVSLNQKI